MTDLVWDQWKITPASGLGADGGLALNIQGTSLHDILVLVRAEIDKLRRGDPKAAIAALSNRFDDEKAKNKMDMARVNEKIDRLNKKLMEGVSNDGLEDKLKKAIDRIRELEVIVHTKIPPPVQPVVTDLENRVKMLEEKLHDFENSCNKGPEIPDDMLERLVSVEKKSETISEKCANLSDRVRQLEDSTFALSSQQGKIIGDIAKLATSNEATQRNLDNVENMTDRHTEDIKDLFANKADISDLNDKFRASGPPVGAAGSARQPSSAHDGKLADMVHELDKQLKMLSIATTEGLNGVQKKTDKKIEFMTNWIIKYLKNLLNNGGGDSDKETDIGKVQMAVKCLVCNKPAKQNENDGATPHPNFRTTFGVKKERKVRTDSQGNRLDSGNRGLYNTLDDWRVQRSESPPRISDSPPTVERNDRPKSAGPNKPPHVRAIQLADSFEAAALPGNNGSDVMQRSATYNGEEEDRGTPFYQEMENSNARHLDHMRIIDYSDKAIAVFGDTRPIKDSLKALGGRFNGKLKNGDEGIQPGWIFPNSKRAEVEDLIERKHILENHNSASIAIDVIGNTGSAPASDGPAKTKVASATVAISCHLRVVNYSDKAIAVFGDTRPIKDSLKALGGRFNGKLKNGDEGIQPGWIFPNSKRAEVEDLIAEKGAAEVGTTLTTTAHATEEESGVGQDYERRDDRRLKRKRDDKNGGINVS